MIITQHEKILKPEWSILSTNDILGNNGEPVLNNNSKIEIHVCLATYNATKMKLKNIFFKHKDVHKYP
jgi:hypothetical protein